MSEAWSEFDMKEFDAAFDRGIAEGVRQLRDEGWHQSVIDRMIELCERRRVETKRHIRADIRGHGLQS
jgi:hypothetical protein